MIDIEKARQEVNDMYRELSPMVEDIVNKYALNINNLVNKISKAQFLTNDELRDFMLSLSVEAYNFSMSKDSSILKQDCAITIMKEAQAKEYNNTEGTQVIRNNASIINTSDSQVVNLLYSSVANLMKTKLDEAHRMINTLNSILISRNAEAKLSFSDVISSQEKGRQLLNE